jgi:MFS family permease
VTLALRTLILSIDHGRTSILVSQVLDGISASIIGVMVPLVVSDLTHSGGQFNLAMGLVGLAMMAGATLSTAAAGFIMEQFGTAVAFLGLAVAASMGFLLGLVALPEIARVHDGARLL